MAERTAGALVSEGKQVREATSPSGKLEAKCLAEAPFGSSGHFNLHSEVPRVHLIPKALLSRVGSHCFSVTVCLDKEAYRWHCYKAAPQWVLLGQACNYTGFVSRMDMSAIRSEHASGKIQAYSARQIH